MEIENQLTTTTALKKRGRNELISLDFMLNVVFPPITNAQFRVTSTTNADQDSTTLKVEKLKFSQQWRAEITDIAKHGPAGIPKEAVFKALKKALGSLTYADDYEEEIEQPYKTLRTTNDYSLASHEDHPSLEVSFEEGGSLRLVLKIPFMGCPLHFIFELLPVTPERIDVLEAALKSSEEEIEKLKMKLKTAHTSSFISLRTSRYDANSVITWDILEYNSSPTTFHRSEDLEAIQVKFSGFYQVNVRVTAPTTAETVALELRRNESAVSIAFNQNEKKGSISVQINDIIQLNANDEVSIHFNVPKNVKKAEASHQLWMMRVA